MTKKINEQKKVIGTQCSELYKDIPTNEVAKLFSCLSTEIQDELLSAMRELVAKNEMTA